MTFARFFSISLRKSFDLIKSLGDFRKVFAEIPQRDGQRLSKLDYQRYAVPAGIAKLILVCGCLFNKVPRSSGEELTCSGNQNFSK